MSFIGRATNLPASFAGKKVAVGTLPAEVNVRRSRLLSTREVCICLADSNCRPSLLANLFQSFSKVRFDGTTRKATTY
jgi:hypothetical protein